MTTTLMVWNLVRFDKVFIRFLVRLHGKYNTTILAKNRGTISDFLLIDVAFVKLI